MRTRGTPTNGGEVHDDISHVTLREGVESNTGEMVTKGEHQEDAGDQPAAKELAEAFEIAIRHYMEQKATT